MKRGKFAGILLAALSMVFLSPAATNIDCVSVSAVSEEMRVIPGGHAIGVALLSDGLVVVGTSDVDGNASPARKAGLRPGDVIQSANDIALTESEQLAEIVQENREIRLTAERDGKSLTFTAKPVYDPRQNAWRLGVWVRDSAAGLGTLTYYNPNSRQYGALGHAIADADTSILLPIAEGAIYPSTVIDVQPGKAGNPGELLGSFFDAQAELGTLESNTEYGIFGHMNMPIQNELYPEGIPVAKRDEVKVGSAQILTTLDDGVLRAYDCKITRLYDQATPSTRSMALKVTDPELLAVTGGIVQGMSGSPIVQDGKLVGAVTHVFVNDPSQGYGIYMDWMLAEAGETQGALPLDPA